MNFYKTKIDGLIILKPEIIEDHRGYFVESFNTKKINKVIGDVKFIQDNESRSKRGVLRGLHFQKSPHSQAKLVRCVKGEILDVALDLRTDSKSFGTYEKTIISESNRNQLFIPKGFAHGFLVLSEYAIVSYKVDDYHYSDLESGVIWNDPDLNIDWQMKEDMIIISQKDKNQYTLKEIINSL